MHDRGGVGHLLDPERAAGRGREELARGLRLDADVGRDERETPVGGDAQRDDVGRPQRQHEGEPADDARRDVVEMPPRHGDLALERGGDDGERIGRFDAHRQRRRVRAADAARRAPAEAARDRQTFVDGDDGVAPVAVRAQPGGSGEPGGVAARIERDELRIAPGDRGDARVVLGELDGDAVADRLDRQAEDVEAGAAVADGAGGEDGGGHDFVERCPLRAPLRRSSVAIATMSFSTPAAVTVAPAPGPVTTSGFLL